MLDFSARMRRDGVRSLLAVALASVSALALSAPASAQSVGTSRADTFERDYDIPAQPLASALLRFAEQSDLQVLFAQDELDGLVSAELRGRFTPTQALSILMSRSGREARITPAGAVAIEAAARPQTGGGRDEVRGDPDGAADGSDELIVTGTRIRGAAPAGANVITIDRNQIEQSGRSTVQGLIQTLPQNFAGSQNEATQEGTLNARSNFTFASTVDLRGLGADATLTLVNGRRLAPAGVGNFIDISAIPLSAVERIEVLADGASATYGSDAVGGVVNIILDRNFSGAESSLRAGGATQGGAEDYGFSHLAGFARGSGNVTGGYEYRRRGEVDMLERPFTASSDFRPFGGSNFNRLQSNPGNITRIGTTNVSLAIPAGQDGTSLSEADLIVGAPNLGELNPDAWLMPRQESHSLFLSGSQELGANFEIFADVLATVRDVYSERENLTANLVVPESNAWRQLNNLFPGQGPLTIAYHFGDDLGPQTTETETRALSLVIGGAWSLENDRRVDLSAALAQSDEDIVLRNFYNSATAALASSDLATAFNPFADGSNTNPALLATITSDQFVTTTGETRTYALKADGPLFELWGGTARAAFGIEQRQEEYAYSRIRVVQSGATVLPTQSPGSREVDALFAELSLPLVGAENAIPFVMGLDLSLSARREEASDYGAETTPKIGLTWDVLDGLAFRGSWGRSFKGPNFQQLLGGAGVSYLTASAAQDPLADNGSTGVLAVAGANADLGPERAESWTAGLEFAPSWLSGFRASATYFDIDFADRVSTPTSALTILRNPAGYESMIIRDPTPEQIAFYTAISPPTGTLPAEGVEVIIDQRFVNLSSQRIRGVDASVDYALQTDLGAFTFSAAGSLLLQHDSMLTPGATPIDQLDILNGPIDWRARASVFWRGGDWTSGLSVNFADNYTDNVSTPNRKIDSYRTWDFHLARDWRDEGSNRGAVLSLSIQNIFDEDPPFVNNVTGYGYDPSNHSPLGRVVSLQLRQRW